MRVLSELERFINEGEATPIAKAGLTRAQFKTIHPFLDGNRRIGRLLNRMVLCADGAKRQKHSGPAKTLHEFPIALKTITMERHW